MVLKIVGFPCIKRRMEAGENIENGIVEAKKLLRGIKGLIEQLETKKIDRVDLSEKLNEAYD